MNEIGRRSFYSFLALYILSSLLFISLIGYWYYRAERGSLEKENYYRLQHIADQKAGDIIYAQMNNKPLQDMNIPEDVVLALIDTKGKVADGRVVVPNLHLKTGYYTIDGYSIIVSDAPKEHLRIKYVVVQSDSLNPKLTYLQNFIFKTMILLFTLIAIVAWMLSKIFMRPIHQKAEQIEDFINNITHELNTPITGLSVSTEQALMQNRCTQKTLKNISISTKQLYDIYRSLTYLNFSSVKDDESRVDISKVLQDSILYYSPICESKRIEIVSSLHPCNFTISITKLQLLYGNLIGNAIKYSYTGSTINISLKDGVLSIKDQGIGIDPDKQKDIYKKFERGTEYAGGFGVGLNIVKNICDEYDIKIELDSALDRGTEFRLFFR